MACMFSWVTIHVARITTTGMEVALKPSRASIDAGEGLSLFAALGVYHLYDVVGIGEDDGRLDVHRR